MSRRRPSAAEMQLQLLHSRPAAHPPVEPGDGKSSALEELGPILPPRVAVHAQALELMTLANRAVEFSGTGPTANLPASVRQLERMRAILGAPGALDRGPRCGCPQIVVDRVERGGTCGRGGCPYGGDF